MLLKQVNNYWIILDDNLKQVPGQYKLRSQALKAFEEYINPKVSIKPVEYSKPTLKLKANE